MSEFTLTSLVLLPVGLTLARRQNIEWNLP